jgi:dTDP-D-glucose 4,6-dehydratase
VQPGDVVSTYADTSRLEKDFNYHPSTSIETGINSFYQWFTKFYKIRLPSKQAQPKYHEYPGRAPQDQAKC